MVRISLEICLVLVVASSVIYEAQGTFLLKMYLRNQFPQRCNDFTPYANKGMTMLVTNLETVCPATTEFKSFFTQLKGYMAFIETSSATSNNVDVEMETKCNGLVTAMSALSGGKAQNSAGFKSTMLSMGKTLIQLKKSRETMTVQQKKELVVSMVKWTRTVATSVKTVSEQKGKSIDISSYGLDVDVNDKAIVGGSSKSSGSFSSQSETSSTTEKGSSSHKFKAESSSKKGDVAGSDKTKKESGSKTKSANEAGTDSDKTSSKKKEKKESGGESGSKTKSVNEAGTDSDKTSSKKKEKKEKKESGGESGSKTKSVNEAGTDSDKTSSKKKEKKESGGDSGSKTKTAKEVGADNDKTSSSKKKESDADSPKKESGKVSFKDTTGGNMGTSVSGQTVAKATASQTTSSSSSTTSVKQVESETSKEVMTFISGLEQKYSGKAELKVFFDKLKASMTASSTISSKSAKDYLSMTRSATSQLSDAMNLMGSRYQKSAKMKSNMETNQEKLLRTLKELQDIKGQIVTSKSVTSTQQSQIKQTISKFEQVTSQYVETAASSSSSSSSASFQQKSASSQKSTSSMQQQQQSNAGIAKEN